MCEDDFMKPKEREYEPIQTMENKVKELKGAWLQKHGWVYRCDFIDNGWRWCKTIKGVLMMCDMFDAIDIEYNYLDT